MSDFFKLPEGHKSFHDASHRMSIDKSNNLHWNGVPVKTELSVPLIAKIAASLIAFATFIGGIGSFTQGWVAYQQYVTQQKTPASQPTTAEKK
jgi:hypothetical protein